MRCGFFRPSALLLALVTGGLVLLVSATGGFAETSLLQKPVASFKLERASLLDALLSLGQQEHIPLGIEYVNLQDLERQVSVQVASTTVGSAVKAILGNFTGYTLHVADGVLNISHSDVPAGRRNLLDHVVPEFVIDRPTNLQTANNVLWMAFDRTLHQDNRGYIGHYPAGNTARVVGPLKMDHVTTRSVLNRLVRERGDAAWIVQVPPQYLDQLWNACRSWRIVEYDDPGIRYESKVLRENLRKYGPARSK